MALSARELASYIDHTVLKPAATGADVEALCIEAIQYGFFGLCVNPSMISVAAKALEGEIPVPVSVVGFPLGATVSEAKAYETAKAIEGGAREIDMVLNLGAFKAGDDSTVLKDVQAVVGASDGFPVKVILETALLSGDEIIRACKICVDGGALFVKTSTGFGPGGASVDAVKLMRQTVGPNIGVKASGGISSYEDAVTMINAGANRIGASASIAIVLGK